MAGKKGVKNPHNDRQRLASYQRAQEAMRAILSRQVAVSGPAAWHRDQHLSVLRDRVHHPDLPLSAIAAKRGQTKDTYAGALARAIKYGERMREGKDR